MQQSDSARECLLLRSGAGDGEVNGAELCLGEVFVMVMVFVVVGESSEYEEDRKEQQPGESFHRNLTIRSDRIQRHGILVMPLGRVKLVPVQPWRVSGAVALRRLAALVPTQSCPRPARPSPPRTSELLGAQCVHRFDTGSASGRNESRDGREYRQDQDCTRQRKRIIRTDAV